MTDEEYFESTQRIRQYLLAALELWSKNGGTEIEDALEKPLDMLLNYLKDHDMPVLQSMMGLGLIFLYTVTEAELVNHAKKNAH
jgi:hypothetical protein